MESFATGSNVFSHAVATKLQAYVYRLIDPRNGETFYVGKGRGNRVFQHAVEAKIYDGMNTDIMAPKLDLIREIRREGHEVQHVIHRHGMDDDTAFHVEAALIDAYPALHNAVRGHYASVYGIATVTEILQRYDLPVLSLDQGHRLLVLTLNKLLGRRDPKVIFDLVRYCWPLSSSRVKTVEYVLAVDRGAVVGAFKPLSWAPARASDFPDIAGLVDVPKRLAFQGEVAPPEIWDTYVGQYGKSVNPLELPPARHACRYINC